MAEPFLIDLTLLRDRVPSFDEYPFAIPAIRSLDRIEFHAAVTFFVGENGTGKSTLLEALAVAEGFNAEGGSRNFNFATRPSHSSLYECLRLGRGVRRLNRSDAFFFRAESFFNVATEVDRLGATNSYGGASLHEQSHGESFLSLLNNRFGGNGLYLLDEPEAALSPTRQMSLLVAMHDLIERGSQFVIATHAPIILAYPQATIYSFAQKITKIDYCDTEHYKVTKAFLDCPERMMAHLFGRTTRLEKGERLQ